MSKSIILSALLFIVIGVKAQSGQTMPSVTLKDVHGKTVNTADYSKSGKITVVSFWATWCTPCKKELTNINDNLLDDWKTKYGVNLVAVCTDNSRNVPKVKLYRESLETQEVLGYFHLLHSFHARLKKPYQCI